MLRHRHDKLTTASLAEVNFLVLLGVNSFLEDYALGGVGWEGCSRLLERTIGLRKMTSGGLEVTGTLVDDGAGVAVGALGVAGVRHAGGALAAVDGSHGAAASARLFGWAGRAELHWNSEFSGPYCPEALMLRCSQRPTIYETRFWVDIAHQSLPIPCLADALAHREDLLVSELQLVLGLPSPLLTQREVRGSLQETDVRDL